MKAKLTGGIHDGAVFELMYDDPPDLLEVFRCPHCDELHHAAPEEYEAMLKWQERRGEDPPIDPALYSLKEIVADGGLVAHYEQVGLALPTPIESRELAHA